jgi:hypothetical protein
MTISTDLRSLHLKGHALSRWNYETTPRLLRRNNPFGPQERPAIWGWNIEDDVIPI